jgi:hypothetical protein
MAKNIGREAMILKKRRKELGADADRGRRRHRYTAAAVPDV